MATLTQLEYLVAVEKLRHFGRAAKACHVSQPTLSMQLHKLEEEYGVTFFDRSKQPILTTVEGAELIEQAKAVLREMGRLDFIRRNRSAAPSGELKLAVIPTLAPYLLPRFLGDFAQRHPKVKLVIQEMTTESIIDALEDDEIDAGVLATPLHAEHLTERPLFYEPFLLYLSAGHPLGRLERIHEEKLDAKDIWLLSEGHCLRSQVIRVCSLRGKPGIFPNVRFESGSLETVIHLVEQGHGYTLLPLLATQGFARSRKEMLKPFAKPIPSREVSLVYRRTQFKLGILDALTEAIQQSLPDDLPRERSKAIEVVGI
jgi:LysR family hydrogen peroxide-inducible transcriptional activator